MCLAVPGQIVAIDDSDSTAGRLATVNFQGSQMEASLAMTPDAAVGDWILVHAGFALTVLDENEARETFDSLRQALGDDANPEAGV